MIPSTNSDRVADAVRCRGGVCDLDTLTRDLLTGGLPKREVMPAIVLAIIGHKITQTADGHLQEVPA